MAPQVINWAIYNSLPVEEARYQLANVHDSKIKSVTAAEIICYIISFSAVILRFVSRRIGRVSYKADDWSIVVALLLTVLDSVPSILAAFVYGGAQHAILMSEDDLIKFAKSVYAAEILYPPCIAVVKISTLLLYARIFPVKKFKRMLWTVGLFISIYTTVGVISFIFQCRPVSRVWDPTVKAECIDVSKIWIVMGSLNVLTDFLLLCLPLPQLWRLQMRKESKLQLIGLFSIGSLVTVISLYRIPQMSGMSPFSNDPSWTDIGPDVWSIVESSLAILGACAITYRPLLNWILQNWIMKVQSSLSRLGDKRPWSGLIKSSRGNNHPKAVVEMHIPSLSDLSVPRPTFIPPRKLREGKQIWRSKDSLAVSLDV